MKLNTKSYPGLAIAEKCGVPYKVVLLLADKLAGRNDYWTDWAMKELGRMPWQDAWLLETEIRERMYLG